METVRSNVFIGRNDTFFGVCEALGEDFGFNPLFLRIAFALGVFFNPVAAVAAYFAAGLVVAVSRFIAPNPRVAEPEAVETAEPSEPEAEEAQEELPLAA